MILTRLVALLLLLLAAPSCLAQSPPSPTVKTLSFVGSTVAGLRSFHPPGKFPYAARVSGYAGDGDGGGGEYIWNNGSTAPDDGCLTIAPAGQLTGRWIAVVGDGGLNVRRCGAAGDGASDDTASFQTAVNALCAASANGGGTLLVPLGAFAINAGVGVTIPCQGVNVLGLGWGDRDINTRGSQIKIIGAGSAPILNFTGASKNASSVRFAFGGGVRNVAFYASNGGTPAQLGPMISFNFCWGCVVDHVYAYNAYVFVTNYAGVRNRLNDFSADQMAPGGEAIRFSGSDAGCEPGNVGNCPTRADIFEISHGVVDEALIAGKQTGACIHITDFAATTWIDHVACNQTVIGLNVDCPDSTQLAACPQFINAVDFETETNGNNDTQNAGIVLSDVVHFECDACEIFGYNTTYDVLALSARFPGASNIQFHGGRMASANNQCVLSSVQELVLDGVHIDSCNISNGGFYGVEVRQNTVGSTVSTTNYSGSNTIIGSHFCVAVGGIPTSMGGVLIGAGQAYNVVTGNTFRGCTAGVVNDDGNAGVDVIGPNSGP